MAERTSTQELKYRYQELKEGLQIDDKEILDMLQKTRKHDDMGLEIIIRSEGEKIAINNFIFDIEDDYLRERSIEEIYKYKEISTDDWDFLTKKQKTILRNTLNFFKSVQREYLLNRADLMILRKEVDNFVRYSLAKVNSTANYEDMVRHVINNYSYSDSMRGYGFSVTQSSDGSMVYLNPLELDEKTLKYK